MKSNYDSWLIQQADQYWSQRLESDKDQIAKDTNKSQKSTADYYRELNKRLLAQANHFVDANK